MALPARRTDPATSHAAAAHVAASGQQAAQQQVAAAVVRAYPGRTSLELAQVAGGMDRYVLARRLPECERLQTVRRGRTKTCSVSGRQAATWWPPEAEEQLPLTLETDA